MRRSFRMASAKSDRASSALVSVEPAPALLFFSVNNRPRWLQSCKEGQNSYNRHSCTFDIIGSNGLRSQTGILDNYSSTRLLELEALQIARKFSSEVNWLRKASDKLIAKVENRLIERILLGRLRSAVRASKSAETADRMISEMRGAYASGNMETLPSFVPQSYFAHPDQNPGNFKVSSKDRAKILYVPGGGFIFPPSRRQKVMMQRLSEQTGCEVIPGIHSLAPEAPFPAAPKEIAEQLQDLTSQSSQNAVFLGADTAGASVALGAIQLLQKLAPDSLPIGIILFSPWCDLSLSGWSYITKSVTSESPFRMETAAFCARMYLQRHGSTDPLASPVFADLKGWPPILIHTSENDLHFDDAIQLAENGRQAGSSVTINYWDSPRHHLERLSSRDAERSFSEVRKFIQKVT